MKYNDLLAKAIAFIALCLFISCDDTTTNKQIDETIIPPTNVSYSTHILPVLILKCASSGCHDNETRADNLVLTSYTQTVADPSIVFPGQPDNSRLMWAVKHQSGAAPMPPVVYPQLTTNQIDGIYTWIKEGARNN